MVILDAAREVNRPIVFSIAIIIVVFLRARPCSRGVYNNAGMASPVSFCAWPEPDTSRGSISMRQHLTSLAVALVAVAAPASAQDVWDETGGVETEATYEAAVAAASDADGSVLYTLRSVFAANLVLDNGAEVGFRASGGFDKDNPSRAGFSGLFGPGQPAPTPSGAFSGLARGPDAGEIGRAHV
jgi:hypothetical protein